MIGRSHEEPVFGSGNIFDLNSDCLPQHKTSRVRHTQNTDNSDRVSDQTIDCQLKCHQRLVRSSSIDTMQVLVAIVSLDLSISVLVDSNYTNVSIDGSALVMTAVTAIIVVRAHH